MPGTPIRRAAAWPAAPGFRTCAALWLAAALAIRLPIACQPVVYLDRLFLPDDFFYSLAIARNIARGLIPSVDGRVFTTGFQPLVTFLQAPFFLAGLDGDAAAACAVLQGAIVGALAAASLGLLLLRLGRARAGWAAALAAAASPALILNDLNGLETALACLALLLVLHAFLSVLRRPDLARLLLLGALIGVSLLARVDACFMAICVGLHCARRIGWRSIIVVAAALAVVAPWWLFCLAHGRSFVPESGAAVHQITRINHEPVLPMIFLAVACFGALLPVAAVPLKLSVLKGCAALLGAARRDDRAAGTDPAQTPVIACMAAAAALHWAFYVLYEPAHWFFPRYLHFAIITCIALLALRLDSWLAGRLRPVWLAASVLLLAGNLVDCRILLSRPESARSAAYDGDHGYREAALEILRMLPPGSTVGALQSGALGYYAPAGTRVINLDGVVNHDAFAAVRDSALAAYIQRLHIGFFADCALNLDFLQRRLGTAGVGLALMPVGRAAPQRTSIDALYEITAKHVPS